jgi:hypothetical protein
LIRISNYLGEISLNITNIEDEIECEREFTSLSMKKTMEISQNLKQIGNMTKKQKNFGQ